MIKLKNFLFENHPLTNIVTVYDKTKLRPFRALLHFIGLLLSLGITVYYGDEIASGRGVLILLLSAIITSLA
jgi:hypothetical protein